MAWLFKSTEWPELLLYTIAWCEFWNLYEHDQRIKPIFCRPQQPLKPEIPQQFRCQWGFQDPIRPFYKPQKASHTFPPWMCLQAKSQKRNTFLCYVYVCFLPAGLYDATRADPCAVSWISLKLMYTECFPANNVQGERSDGSSDVVLCCRNVMQILKCSKSHLGLVLLEK